MGQFFSSSLQSPKNEIKEEKKGKDKQAVTGSGKNWIGINVMTPTLLEQFHKIQEGIAIPKGYKPSQGKHPNHITLLYGITPAEFDALLTEVEDFKLDPSKFTIQYVARTPNPIAKPHKEGHPTYPVFVALCHPDLAKFQEILARRVSKWDNKYAHPDPNQDQTPMFRMHLTLCYWEAEWPQTPLLSPKQDIILYEPL
jgi:hypothetical protein